MTTNHATEAADHVTQALDGAKTEGDQTKALEKLQDEIKEDTKNMSPAEQKAYMAQLTKDLEAKNQLPILAVAFAGQLGDINKGELNGELRAANRAERNGDSSRQLEKAMLQYLVNNYDQGANLVETKNEQWGRTDSNISKADVSEKLSQFRTARDEQHRKENNQVSAEKNARALLDGGDKSLFNFMDRGNGDGQLTKKELQDYLNDARSSGSSSGHFSKEKQQVVENILKDWDNRDGGKWMRGGSMGDDMATEVLTKQGLINASGKKTESEVTHQKKEDVKITAKTGEGYWQIAERNLGKDGKPHSAEEVRAESERISKLNGGRPVKAGDEIKVGEELRPEKPEKIPPPASKKVEMEVKQGDSYWAIASRILGNKATATEILEKTAELQKKNGNAPLIFNPRHPQTIKI